MLGQVSKSKSWRVADRFAKYFGVKKKYAGSSFASFTNAAVQGNFIAYDKVADKDWNHIAFVMAGSNTRKTYGKTAYYDIQIAQHSSPYNSRISKGAIGWVKMANKTPKTNFGIIK